MVTIWPYATQYPSAVRSTDARKIDDRKGGPQFWVFLGAVVDGLRYNKVKTIETTE